MSARHARAPAADSPRPAAAADGDVMIRFLITPMPAGTWRWETFDRAGRGRTRGIAPTRRIAAAVVIREILKARHGAQLRPACARPSAEAA